MFWIRAFVAALLITAGFMFGRWTMGDGLQDLIQVLHRGVVSLETWASAQSSDIVEATPAPAPSSQATLPLEASPAPTPLSPFDDLVQSIAKEYDVDWRLISSMMFVESSFRPHAVSPAGAKGLMQIMPVVAQEMRITNLEHPETNIIAGVKHLLRWHRFVKGASADDRLKFALASFNGGPGHVVNAQRLAFRLKRNPMKWSHVKQVLPLLEHRFYHVHSTTGYCRGSDMVTYVDRVMKTYAHYMKRHPDGQLLATQGIGGASDMKRPG